MKDEVVQNIRELLEEKYNEHSIEMSENLKEESEINILKIKEVNAKQPEEKVQPEEKETENISNKRLVAIQKTQYVAGMKLQEKILGSYRVTAVKSNHRYDVSKVEEHDEPCHISSSAEYMKPWTVY